MTAKQYVYKFNADTGVSYTIVASRYEQARSHFKKVVTAGYIVTYAGRYIGPAVRNGSCVSVVSN